MRIRVLADDLTGAADAGVAFAPARLLLGPDPTTWLGPAPRVVLDSATRDGPEADARTRVRSLAKALLTADIGFKKIDSTLRGHLAAELAELRAAAPDAAIVLAPSLPQLGRTVRNGVLHIHGEPQSDRPLPGAAIGLREVRSDLATRLQALGGIAACDATTDADLDRIVAAGLTLRRPVIWVGSGGLAKALARRLSASGAPIIPALTRFLAIIGSPYALRQTDLLVRDGATLIEIPVSATISVDGHWTDQIADAVKESSTVVRLIGPRHEESARVAGGLAAICAPAIAGADLLVLAGGQTARAVLVESGIAELEIVAEPDPGIVLSTTDTLTPRYVMTKAGSFGDDDALRRALRRTIGKGQP